MTFNNHLKSGNVEVVHKNKKVTTSLNSKEFESFAESMDLFDFDIGNIPPGYEHRADKISYLFYDTPTLDWLICWFNQIKDPFQELNVTDLIKIPKLL